MQCAPAARRRQATAGLALDLAYILFFNELWKPLGLRCGTLATQARHSLPHFRTVCHLAAVSAIRQVDPEFEADSASLKVPVWINFRRVMPPIPEIFVHPFVTAMALKAPHVAMGGRVERWPQASRRRQPGFVTGLVKSPMRIEGWLRAYCGGKAAVSRSASAACQAQRGS
jgi:hypothetical protein